MHSSRSWTRHNSSQLGQRLERPKSFLQAQRLPHEKLRWMAVSCWSPTRVKLKHHELFESQHRFSINQQPATIRCLSRLSLRGTWSGSRSSFRSRSFRNTAQEKVSQILVDTLSLFSGQVQKSNENHLFLVNIPSIYQCFINPQVIHQQDSNRIAKIARGPSLQ